MTPPTIPHVYRAIRAIIKWFAENGGIPKSHRNEQQNYSFRGIDDIYLKLAPLLIENNIIILPQGQMHQIEDYAKADGKLTFKSSITMNFKFVSLEDGSIDHVVFFGEAMDSSDKATNKAHSAAYKLMAIQTFCIPTGEPEQDIENSNHDEVKSPAQRRSNNGGNGSATARCPECGSNTAVIVNQFKDSDYSCYRKKGGCGTKFNKDGSVLQQA